MAKIIIEVTGLYNAVRYVKQELYCQPVITENIEEAKVFESQEQAEAFRNRVFRFSFVDLEKNNNGK